MLSDAESTEGSQHVGERRGGFRRVPRTPERLPVAMAFAGEPQHDQAVQQHGQRCCAFDRASSPAGRLLEPQVLFAVMVRHFQTPAHGVSGEDLFSGRLRARRVERFRSTSPVDRFDRDNTERASRRRMNVPQLVRDSRHFTSTVDVQRDSTTTLRQQRLGCRQSFAAPMRATIRPRLPHGSCGVQPGVFEQTTGQITVRGQATQHALATVGTIRDDVKTLAFPMITEHGQHLDGEFRSRAIRIQATAEVRRSRAKEPGPGPCPGSTSPPGPV